MIVPPTFHRLFRLKTRILFRYWKTPMRMIRDSKTFWWAKFLSWKIFGFSITKRLIQCWSYCPKKFWTGMIWLLKVFNHQRLTWASIQLTLSLSIFLTRLLLRWLNIISASFKLFSRRTMKVSDQWFLIILKFRIQFIDHVKL